MNAFNPIYDSVRGRWIPKFETRLIYRASARTARLYTEKPWLKNKQTKNQFLVCSGKNWRVGRFILLVPETNHTLTFPWLAGDINMLFSSEFLVLVSWTIHLRQKYCVFVVVYVWRCQATTLEVSSCLPPAEWVCLVSAAVYSKASWSKSFEPGLSPGFPCCLRSPGFSLAQFRNICVPSH